MRRTVHDVDRIFGILPVFMIALDLVHLLVQRSAERHDEFLESATDGHERYTRLEHGPRQRQGRRIAMRVVQRARLARLAGVVVRLDVRQAAGQEHAVHLLQQLIDMDVLRHDRNHQRHGIRAVDNGPQVFFADDMKRMNVDRLAACRHANNGSRAHEKSVFEDCG